MYRRVLSTFLLCVLMAAAVSCRSRRPAAAPQAAPPPATITIATETPVSVPEPIQDFAPRTESETVVGRDIVQANRVARERGWIQDAFFAFDATGLDSASQESLRRSAEWLRQNPEYRVRVEGHCDERGTAQYNLALGERRAAGAASYLIVLGVDRDRIETISYGEERPFREGSSEAAWAENRRAHLVLIGRQ